MSAPPWGDRAQELLDDAAKRWQRGEGDEALIAASGALACMRVAMGDTPEDGLIAYFNGDGPLCICPSDLVARGGYKGNCPAYHVIAASAGSGEE